MAVQDGNIIEVVIKKVIMETMTWKTFDLSKRK